MTAAEHLKAAIASTLQQYPRPDITDTGLLVCNLVFLWHTMRASENLLALAVQHSDGDLKAYFAEHLEEERSHETWLADDLASIGIDVKNTIVPRAAVELVGSQYYLIQHVHPAALFGYMAMMECFPASLDVVQSLEAIHGKTLLRTLRYHAENDVDHGADLLAAYETLPPHLQALALQSGVQSAHYFGSAMAALQVNNPANASGA